MKYLTGLLLMVMLVGCSTLNTAKKEGPRAIPVDRSNFELIDQRRIQDSAGTDFNIIYYANPTNGHSLFISARPNGEHVQQFLSTSTGCYSGPPMTDIVFRNDKACEVIDSVFNLFINDNQCSFQ